MRLTSHRSRRSNRRESRSRSETVSASRFQAFASSLSCPTTRAALARSTKMVGHDKTELPYPERQTFGFPTSNRPRDERGRRGGRIASSLGPGCLVGSTRRCLFGSTRCWARPRCLANLLDGPRSDAADSRQIVEGLVRPMPCAIFEDAAGERGADARQSLELIGVGVIDIHRTLSPGVDDVRLGRSGGVADPVLMSEDRKPERCEDETRGRDGRGRFHASFIVGNRPRFLLARGGRLFA